MRLAFWILETVEPYLRAMAESVSPFFTVYRTEVGLGLGFGFGLGFGVVLTTFGAVEAAGLVVGLGSSFWRSWGVRVWAALVFVRWGGATSSGRRPRLRRNFRWHRRGRFPTDRCRYLHIRREAARWRNRRGTRSRNS